MGSVWGNFSLLLTFIVVIHNVIKKCDIIEGKGFCRKERYVITPIYIHNIPCIHIVLLLKVYEFFFSISTKKLSKFPIIFQYQVINSTNFHNLQIKVSTFSHRPGLIYIKPNIRTTSSSSSSSSSTFTLMNQLLYYSRNITYNEMINLIMT